MIPYLFHKILQYHQLLIVYMLHLMRLTNCLEHCHILNNVQLLKTTHCQAQ